MQVSETILLVEDDDVVRHLTEHILVEAGYTVMAASNGDEAIPIYEQHSDKIHLLLTDVIMTGTMNGPALAAYLSSLRPDIKVLFVSGYAGDSDVQDQIMKTNRYFLPKPFTPRVLTSSVRDILDS